MSTTKQQKTVEPAAEYKTDIQLKLINLIKWSGNVLYIYNKKKYEEDGGTHAMK